MERPPLPDFETPPVTEVALSMQFEELTDFRAIHLGLLWQTLGQSRFPKFEEQPPVQPSTERIGATKVVELPKVELLEIPPMPRYLFVSEDGTEVVQVQPDRFTVNWRKRSESDIYPRFERLLDLFQEQVALFEEFLSKHDLGRILVNQAEVTYVNRIRQTTEPRKLDRIFAVFSGAFTDDFLQEAEESYSYFRFPIDHEDRRIGSLYVDVRPETPGDQDSPLKMVLLARGKPAGSSTRDASAFFSGWTKVHCVWIRINNIQGSSSFLGKERPCSHIALNVP